jgi:ATP-dependent Clp protease ATP-binding subunit ClpA
MQSLTKIFLGSAGLVAGGLALLFWRTRRQECKPHWSTNLSGEASTIMQRAQREAMSLGHSYLGTEHLLLGLLQSNGEGTEHLPHLLGVDHQRVRAAILALLGEGRGPLAVMPRAKSVLHRAEQLAAELGHQRIQPDHLLLSLLLEKESLWRLPTSFSLFAVQRARVTRGQIRNVDLAQSW